MTSVYAHSGSLDSKGPVVANDGKVAFARSDDKIFLRETDGTVRELASNVYDNNGDLDISTDGSTVVYEKKSVYNIEKISTATGAASKAINLGQTNAERASDPAVNADGSYVAYVSNWPSSAKHEVWMHYETSVSAGIAAGSERITRTAEVAD